jgi:deoxyribonuclease-4
MPLFGAHMSSAGGVYRAVEAAVKYQCDTVQLFTKAPSQWAAKPISDDDAKLFRTAIAKNAIRCPIVHDSYLINLASPDEALWQKSLAACIDEIQRADLIGARYLVMHPGAHLDAGEEIGIARVAKAINKVHRKCANAGVQILLETTAGQGSTLGHRFEHLAGILSQIAQPGKVGICFDTCHVFAAGYALAPEKEYRATMSEFHRIIGLPKLKAFHLNDSKKPQGSRVDRHEHIGRGHLGLEPFRLLVNDLRFRNKPMILETPKEVDPKDGNMDTKNLAVLRELANQKEWEP